jgi:hypothetical protein
MVIPEDRSVKSYTNYIGGLEKGKRSTQLVHAIGIGNLLIELTLESHAGGYSSGQFSVKAYLILVRVI